MPQNGSANAALLGADMEIYNQLNKEKAAEFFYNSVKKVELNSENSEKNSARFNVCIAAQALNEKELTSISLILKSDLPNDLV